MGGLLFGGGGGQRVCWPLLKLLPPPPSSYAYVYGATRYILYFAVMIAAIASVFVGYRIIAVFGSVLVLAGFLSASFVNPGDNIELMGFLVGFLGGKMLVNP